jgi:impB/mucB/samB family C-terminal domain
VAVVAALLALALVVYSDASLLLLLALLLSAAAVAAAVKTSVSCSSSKLTLILSAYARTCTAQCDDKQGAQEPHKFMGHGECDNFSRSQTLAAATDDGTVLGTAAVALLAGLRCPPTEIRGLGLHVSRLFDAATGAALGDTASSSAATVKVRTPNSMSSLLRTCEEYWLFECLCE